MLISVVVFSLVLGAFLRCLHSTLHLLQTPKDQWTEQEAEEFDYNLYCRLPSRYWWMARTLLVCLIIMMPTILLRETHPGLSLLISIVFLVFMSASWVFFAWVEKNTNNPRT